MSNMNTNSEYLHSYIKKVAKNEISNTDTSGVYTGVIKAVLPGHYEVTLDQSDSESTILAIAMSSADIYEKDDYVYLLRAEISTTINYFIFGKVDAVQETFFNLTDAERFLAEKDSNFSAPDYSTIENENTIKKDANNTLTFDKIIDLGYFQFECNINAQGNEDQKLLGFKVTFLNEQDAVLEDFIFNSTEFYGQPFAESYISFNSKVFHLKTGIDKDAFQKIVISKLEGDEYFTGFSADNVKIVAGSMLEVTAAYQNKITVSNGKNYFDKGENNTGLNNITLTSNVYYNNKKLNADTLQYYWLLKDDTITEGNENYLEYAGNGWRCLNYMQKISGINTNGNNIEIRLWDNKNNIIQLDKTTNAASFSSFVNKVKCLVKYFDTFIESDIIDIYNYENEEFSVELSSTTDSKTIAFKNDKIILKCDIINKNDKIDIKNYIKEYRWYLEDPNEDINITPKDKKGKENTSYNTLTIFDSTYIGALEGNQYKFEEGKTQGRFYCAVTLKPKADAAGLLEKSESVLVDSKAAEVEVTQNIEYKYYIANSHSVIFEETTRTAEGDNTINAGDWLINGDENLDWIGNFFDDEGNSKVFNDLTIFNNGNYNKTEEWFIYYTQRTVWKEGGIIFKTEYWTFPQIARSIIHTTSDGWKNHRIGNSTTQLNTFNQLTNNGTDDGVYYADLGQLTKDTNPDPSKTYYTKDIDGNYKPIQLDITWDFKRNKDGKLEEYYKWDSEEEKYIQVVDVEGQPAVFDNTVTYYKKDGDDYRKLEVNLNNFKAVNTVWPENISNPTQEIYENIDNKLFINATYIRSGTLEVKDKFYASIDQDDVRIAGFNVNNTTLESKNGTVGLNSDNSNLNNTAIWAGTKNGIKYPFQVTHGGKLKATDAEIKGKITATELFIGIEAEENNFNTILETVNKDIATNQSLIENTKKELQQQIDGEITSWFEEGTPIDINRDGTTQIAVNPNPPSNQWVDDNDKIRHEGDLYYDTNTQYCFRWIRQGEDPNYSWTWAQIADEGITEALAAASQAQATADGKITTYYGSTEPENPQVGDLWVPGSTTEGDKENKTKIYIKEVSGNFNWVDLDDSVTKKEVDSAIENITTGYQSAIESLDQKYSGSLYLTASNIPKGDGTTMPAIVLKAKEAETDAGLIYFNTNQLVINSTNLKLNHNGSVYKEDYLAIDTKQLKIIDGTLEIDTANLKINSNEMFFKGVVEAEKGIFGPFQLSEAGFTNSYLQIEKNRLVLLPTNESSGRISFQDQASLYIHEDAFYIENNGLKDFYIQNTSGAGIKFIKDSVNEQVAQYLNIKLTQKITSYYYDTSIFDDGGPNTRYKINIGISLSKLKTTKSGNVTLYYSVDGGTSWKTASIEYSSAAMANIEQTIKDIKANFWSQASAQSQKVLVYILESTNSEQQQLSNSPVFEYLVETKDFTNNILYSLGSFCPLPDKKDLFLGNAANPWGYIYSKDGVIMISDKNKKKNILNLNDNYECFFNSLHPVSFTFKDNSNNRTHLGFIAQDVENSLLSNNLTTQDFAGLCISSQNEYFLRYSEFIALNTWQIQKLKHQILELENKIKEIKGE